MVRPRGSKDAWGGRTVNVCISLCVVVTMCVCGCRPRGSKDAWGWWQEGVCKLIACAVACVCVCVSPRCMGGRPRTQHATERTAARARGRAPATPTTRPSRCARWPAPRSRCTARWRGGPRPLRSPGASRPSCGRWHPLPSAPVFLCVVRVLGAICVCFACVAGVARCVLVSGTVSACAFVCQPAPPTPRAAAVPPTCARSAPRPPPPNPPSKAHLRQVSARLLKLLVQDLGGGQGGHSFSAGAAQGEGPGLSQTAGTAPGGGGRGEGGEVCERG